MMRLKTHVARLVIVCVVALALVYEPGLAVFAVAGGAAALLIVGDAGPMAQPAAPSPCRATDEPRP